MKIVAPALVGLIVVTAGCNSPPRGSPVAPGSNELAFDIYGKLRDREANFVFSPYSISTGLAMLYAGARGRTADEIAQAGRFTLSARRLHSAFGDSLRDLQADVRAVRASHGTYDMLVANALWLKKDCLFESDFKAAVSEQYQGAPKSVDFAKADQARQQINGWVEEHTEHKIADLVTASQLDSLTCMLLTNAIYMRATWGVNFDEKETRPQDFWPPSGQAVTVPMMHRMVSEGDLARYADSDDCQVLLLPCIGRSGLVFVVILPKKRDGLADLERSLTYSRVEKLLSEFRNPEIDLSLPRFKVQSQLDLKPVLTALGIELAFKKTADFSGISDCQPLWVSAASHKAFLDVNERGIEAAAASGFEGTNDGIDESKRVTFKADHPFMFLIRHRKSGQIFFMGRLADPKSSN